MPCLRRRGVAPGDQVSSLSRSHPGRKIRLRKSKLAITVVMLALLGWACTPVRECPPYCATDEEILSQAGAVRLDAEQARAHVSGYTEDWIHGGAYYHADGKLEVVWRKVRYRATWEVSAEGEICYQLENRPRRCHFYMRHEDEILMLDEGRNIGARILFVGNRLASLGRMELILERKK